MSQSANDAKKQRSWGKNRIEIHDGQYEFYPETVHTERFRTDEYQRVAVYARVSTDDPRQASSYELQQQYYEDFVRHHEKWQLVRIYADRGISGTSRKHRDAFNEMLRDAMDGKIDLIITKSVSRYARNVEDFLSSIRKLSDHRPPVGVFFEAENIYSLREDLSMPLSFQATMAEEESRNKSRSMETSLRMRLDHGLPLTPELLGYMHDENGKLIPNPDTYKIPKLMFFMCLFGYSTQQIADKLTALEKKTYLGNAKWTANGVVKTLRNERYCGDVFTRKTFTKDVLSHKSVKNRGERPRSRYLDEHEAIVSRDDFIAVQQILNNSKYKNKSILPTLSVISEGLLKGFVVVHPRWGAFTLEDYQRASASAYSSEDYSQVSQETLTVEANEGDFDFSGFEIAYLDFFGNRNGPSLSLENDTVKFSTECLKKFTNITHVELLVHPGQGKIAVRPSVKDNRAAICWALRDQKGLHPRLIASAAFSGVLYSMFGWNPSHKYRMLGTHLQNDSESVLIFDTQDATAFIKAKALDDAGMPEEATPLGRSGSRIGALPSAICSRFGKDFYQEQSVADLIQQTSESWQIRLKGRLCSTGRHLKITPYEELKAFIQEELEELFWEEDVHGD